MSKNKQLMINLITTLFVLLVNIGINFGLSSYIVESIGEEAFGFISLANNFVSYATIFTVALNSMASRFITIEIQKGNKKTANEYFSSVLIANLAIIALLIIPSVLLILYLEKVVNIPFNIITDVKLLFSFVILNFFVSLVGGVFTIATYCTNKLYLSSIKNMESYFIKALSLIGLFILFKPSVFYVGISTLLAGIFVVFYNIKFTKKLIPEIKIDKNNFKKEKVKTLLSSGIWNTITNLGNILSDGLDLIISNLAISPAIMGVVAIAKTPGAVMNNVIASISNVFQPQMIRYYSESDTDGLVNETKKAMKISSVFGNIPFCYIIVLGSLFFKLWMPSVDNELVTILTILTFVNIFIGGIISPLYNIYTITNKVKANAIIRIASGVISTIIVLILIKTTSLGAYAIVGTSAFIGAILGFIIVPMHTASCLGVDKKVFFPIILKYFLTTIIIYTIFLIIKPLFIYDSWLMAIISVFVYGMIGLIINYLILFSKNDKEYIKDIIKRKVFKK